MTIPSTCTFGAINIFYNYEKLIVKIVMGLAVLLHLGSNYTSM